jgi:hypothetical protein
MMCRLINQGDILTDSPMWLRSVMWGKFLFCSAFDVGDPSNETCSWLLLSLPCVRPHLTSVLLHLLNYIGSTLSHMLLCLLKCQRKIILSLCVIAHHAINKYGRVEVWLHAFLISTLNGG